MRTRIFYNLPESACYGCQACAQICPAEAIKMGEDREGFKFPIIDTSKCIECNLCEKSCPTQKNVLNPLFYPTPANVDAAWERNLEERLESTSGGLFYIIGKKWIEDGGVVYGADYNEKLEVEHTRVITVDGLKRLRGSKYVQSDVTGILSSVKEDLKKGLNVLFSGTPCQVGGLRAFLKKDYPKLVCIDLVCHGIPSPKIFKEHLDYIKRISGKMIRDYRFRGKKKTGWRAYIKYIYADSSVDNSILGREFFAYSFYRSRFNRRSCFSCGFSRSQRVGDITLSDFWNAEKYDKTLKIQRKYGFNMVMCNTKRGDDVYQMVKDDIDKRTLPVDVAINGDVRLRNTEPAPPERDSIFEEYYAHGYDWLVENRFKRSSLKSRLMPIWVKNIIFEIRARL